MATTATATMSAAEAVLVALAEGRPAQPRSPRAPGSAVPPRPKPWPRRPPGRSNAAPAAGTAAAGWLTAGRCHRLR